VLVTMTRLTYRELNGDLHGCSPKARAMPARRATSLRNRKTRRSRDLQGKFRDEGCDREKLPTLARQRVSARAGGLALVGSSDAELLHLPVQRGPFHPEAGGSALRPAQHPTGFLKRRKDVLALGVDQRNR
jgi:hypothetical protein